MYEIDSEVWRHRAVQPGEAWKYGRLVDGSPGEHEPMLDALSVHQPAWGPPCGGSCQHFGVQGCHSPRCRVGAE